jgi:hypothetical protein
MKFFAKSDAIKNIKYIRWAAKVFKVIATVNLLNGLLGLCTNLSGAQVITIDAISVHNEPGLLTTGSFIFNAFAVIFVTYTAARGLELFADVAEKILMPSEHQIEDQPSQPNVSG